MSFLAGLRKQALIAGAVALWIPAVAFGIRIMWQYSATPGHPAEPPVNWPARASIERAKSRPMLLLFAHPHCPCSRASIGELAIVMAHARGQLDVNVFFYLPSAESSTWAATDLWRSASAIPGVRVFEDRSAVTAQSFGVFTSGQALLYDAKGGLLFKGGITASRGHSGDNDGRRAITSLLQGDTLPQISRPVVTPVFGCSLRGG
jgi:hypothetical protein